MRACWKSASSEATAELLRQQIVLRSARAGSRAAPAPTAACSRASSASCSTCGLLSSRMTVSAAPARRDAAGCVRRGRRSSPESSAYLPGTSVPRPRTWRTIEPALHRVAQQRVASSTVGQRRLHPSEHDRHADDDDDADHAITDPAEPAALEDGGVASDVWHVPGTGDPCDASAIQAVKHSARAADRLIGCKGQSLCHAAQRVKGRIASDSQVRPRHASSRCSLVGRPCPPPHNG